MLKFKLGCYTEAATNCNCTGVLLLGRKESLMSMTSTPFPTYFAPVGSSLDLQPLSLKD